MRGEQVFEAVAERFKTKRRTKVLAYTNFDRYHPGMYWLDAFDLAVRDAYGRVHFCLNAAAAGQGSAGFLERFDEEAAPFRPDLAFVLVGGSEPRTGAAEFEDNLRQLQRRFADLGCLVAFMTYYGLDPRHVEAGPLESIHRNMGIVREVAAATGSGLVDHMARWEPFRLAHPGLYLSLMQDCLHANQLGNIVMGLEAARRFGAEPKPSGDIAWSAAMACHRLMDLV